MLSPLSALTNSLYTDCRCLTQRCGKLTCPHAGLHESGVLLQHDVEVVPQIGGQEVWTGVKELEIERGMPLAGGQRCCPQPGGQTQACSQGHV